MNTKKILFSIGLLLFVGSSVFAQQFKYIGANKCKMCHNKVSTGEQYKIWLAGPHANSMKSLSSPQALEIAKEKGIADPATDAGCLSCHSSAAAVPAKLNSGLKPTEGVSCESCHGPGSGYKSATIMKDQEYSVEKGLILQSKEICITCHNEKSPTYIPFDYEEKAKMIAHPNPKNAN